MKGKMDEYERILSGKIEYEFPLKNQKKFEGSIKITKDPKYEIFNISNMIPKASTLIYTDWYS